MNTHQHPIYNLLTIARDPFARHNVLHELEQRVESQPYPRAFANKVHAVVERGVPYFAPGEASFEHLAEQVVALWQRTEQPAGN